MKKNIFFLLSIFILLSCNKEKKYSNIPKITFNSLSHTTIKAGSDSVVKIFIKFEDGDGNIGFGTNNIFVTDSRTPTDTVGYMIPTIPADKFAPENGLSGIIQVDMMGQFLLLRTDTVHTESDTLFWTIYMKDKANNASNFITTTPLILTK